MAEARQQEDSSQLEENSSYKWVAAEACKQASQFLVWEEELEVGLWRLNVWLEDFIYV
jgi:hypothetical protein